MKVMLVQPATKEKRTSGPPLGLAYIASSLEKHGHKVKIIDSAILNYKIDDIQKEIKNFDPDAVGIGTVTRYIYDSISILRIAKKNNPNCITVLGGPHPTVKSRETLLESSHTDIVVRGEGEKTFPELLEKNKKYSEVKGISYRSNGKIIENPDRKFIENLDDLEFPAYHLLPMNNYKIKGDTFGLKTLGRTGELLGYISTCRGCPFSCAFCSSKSLWGEKWRARSAENVIEELNFLRTKYNIRYIDFVDDTFTISRKRTEKICELINKENLDISWICSSRVDIFNKKIAKILKKAGCNMVFYGLESGVQKTLDFLNKKISIEVSEKAVKIAKEADMEVSSGFIIGVPGETKEMINQTIAFAKKLNLTAATFSLLVPFPGTYIYHYAKKNNLLLTEDWSKYTPVNPVMRIPGFTPQQLKNYLFKAIFVCQFRPLNKIKNMILN